MKKNLIGVFLIVLGLVAGVALSGTFVRPAVAGNTQTHEYEVLSPRLKGTAVERRKKVQEALDSKAKFGWRLIAVEGDVLYLEREK